MTKNGTSDGFEITEELRESYVKVGAIRPAIRTKFGVAAGNTRLKAVPDWPVEEREAKTLYEHLRIAAADNLQERKRPQWWTSILVGAAEWLVENEGAVRGEIAARLAKDFGLSRRTILAYLPEEFKDPLKANAGALGGSAAAVRASSAASDAAEPSPVGGSELDSRLSKIGFARLKSGAFADNDGKTYAEGVFRSIHPEVFDPRFESEDIEEPREPLSQRKEPYSKISPRMSEHRRTTLTDPAVALANVLQQAGVELRMEEPWLREGELTSEGKPKTFMADIMFLKRQIIIECEGEGSSSAGNEERDNFFKKRGFVVVHLSNKHVVDYAFELADLVKALI